MSDLSALLDALERDGYAITDGLFDRSLAESLRHEAGALLDEGVFQPAAVGGSRSRKRREAASRPSLASGPRLVPIGEATRTDHIHWLDAAASGIQQTFLGAMESLRQAINQRLMLGLFDLECHFACYAPGGYYRMHLDRFQHDDRRALSAVFYLNDAWTADDGGALRLYLGETAKAQPVHPCTAPLASVPSATAPTFMKGRTSKASRATDSARGPIADVQDARMPRRPGMVESGLDPIGDVPAGEYRDVLPRLGTLALFLSDRYWHEVLPARRPRFAVTGWFRTRG